MQDGEIIYPDLSTERGSLLKTEKQVIGTFMVLSRCKNIVELGVYKGHTTKFICNFLIKNKLEGKVYGFDLPEVINSVIDDSEIKEFVDLGILTFVPGELPLSLKLWLNGHSNDIDFVLDDAGHAFEKVYSELNLIWPRLADDGFCLCHDYSHKYEGVKYAVDKFSKRRDVLKMPVTSSDDATNIGHYSFLVCLKKNNNRWRPMYIIQREGLRLIEGCYNTKLWQDSHKTKLWQYYLRPMICGTRIESKRSRFWRFLAVLSKGS